MNNTFTALLCLVLLSCQTVPKQAEVPLKPIDAQALAKGILYEVNIRQYTNEGTFNAFVKELPKIKALGVNILWLMPVYPISTTKSKGPLGSYYAISDYKGVNPEFGTLEDLKNLVAAAHELGIYVIFDWVAGHTGWDHRWIEEHPEYYLQNQAGEIIDPIDPRTGLSFGWTDVADLNFDNSAMQAAMKEAMLYWINEVGIDGYRIDQAYALPLKFLTDVFIEIRQTKSVFITGEIEQHSGKNPYLNIFDSSYDFPGYELNVEIAKGHQDATAFYKHLEEFVFDHHPEHHLLNFVSTHDKNAWNGTANERFGPAKHAIMALNYLQPGMPFIYGGVEYGLDKRLLFFEKDSFPKVAGDTYQLLKKLGTLKRNNPALHAGKDAAAFHPISTSLANKVVAFERVKENDTIVFMANMSNEHIGFTSPYNAKLKRFQDGKPKQLSFSYEYRMRPWEFWIMTN